MEEKDYRSKIIVLMWNKQENENKLSSSSSKEFTIVEGSDDEACMASKVRKNFKNKLKLSRINLREYLKKK